MNLLKRTNYELMEPLGQLTDSMDTDDDIPVAPDWRQLKRDQRARALREYWERIRKRKERMQELAKLFPRGSPIKLLQRCIDPQETEGKIHPKNPDPTKDSPSYAEELAQLE